MNISYHVPEVPKNPPQRTTVTYDPVKQRLPDPYIDSQALVSSTAFLRRGPLCKIRNILFRVFSVADLGDGVEIGLQAPQKKGDMERVRDLSLLCREAGRVYCGFEERKGHQDTVNEMLVRTLGALILRSWC